MGPDFIKEVKNLHSIKDIIKRHQLGETYTLITAETYNIEKWLVSGIIARTGDLTQ